jgi:murein DD-endopeptidase MepM/ murein hydrolase activator NlpD
LLLAMFIIPVYLTADEIVIHPQQLSQSQPFLIMVSSDQNLIWAEGEIFGISFVLEPAGDALIGLAGVPRNQKPGSYSIECTVKYADGSSTVLRKTLVITKTDYQIQKLSVDPKYVELSKKDLEWVKKDNQAAARAYASSTDSRLWQRPFVKPAEGRWSAPFGVRRMFNGKERSYHSGADIAIPTGTPVVASNDGRIVLVRSMFFGGNTVIIDHGHNVFTGYMHLSKFEVAEGDTVECGQVIGLSGATGRVTGPHLHWMLRMGSEKLDAAGLLNLKVE